MTKIQDQVIWLTGASSGIGEALAYQLAAKGGKLILSARREAQLQEVAQKCRRQGVSEIQILPIDLTQSEILRSKAEQAVKFYGKVYIVIHGSGITQRGTAAQTFLGVEREIMEVNFFGAIAVTKFILPQWQQKQSGHVVVISSIVGKFGAAQRSAYAASKHALHGYFDSLRAEVGQDNIKVTIICPGYVNTPISLNALTPTGTKFNKMNINQVNGISAEVCAMKIIKAIEKNQQEVYIGKMEVLGVYLKRFFPRLFAQIVPKFVPN